MTFKHIIVPYEGGPQSEDALRLACDLARDGAEVTAVYVMKVPTGMPIGAEYQETGLEALRRAEAIGRELGAEVDTCLTKAPEVAQGIREAAEALGADVIVMSLRHKHTADETMILSHTASRILRQAPCRVLITYRRNES